jgi:hypothetical protein
MAARETAADSRRRETQLGQRGPVSAEGVPGVADYLANACQVSTTVSGLSDSD